MQFYEIGNEVSRIDLLMTLLYRKVFIMKKIDREILLQIQVDDSIEDYTIEELREQLEIECKKSDPDYDLINELAEAITEYDCLSTDSIDVHAEIAAIKERANIRRKNHIIPKWVSTVCAACVLLICINTLSVLAWDMNIFSAVIEFTKDGVVIDLNKKQEEIIELPISDDDPYGIREKCAEYDIYPQIPHYLPEGFKLTDVYDDITSSYSEVIFFYRKDDIKINFDFRQYNEGEESSPVGIPSDKHNLIEEKINGQTMYILKEDNRFTATYICDNIVYMIVSEGMDYNECHKVVESLSR